MSKFKVTPLQHFISIEFEGRALADFTRSEATELHNAIHFALLANAPARANDERPDHSPDNYCVTVETRVVHREGCRWFSWAHLEWPRFGRFRERACRVCLPDGLPEKDDE